MMLHVLLIEIYNYLISKHYMKYRLYLLNI